MNLPIPNFSDTEIINFQNPFKQSGVVGINLHYSKILFQQDFGWKGNVVFKKWNTTGEQKFESQELPTMLKEIEAFIKSLET